jgi:phosphoserine phosphatase
MSLPAIWPSHPIVIFDCDSTLSTIEGIDELARISGSEDEIAVLTKQAMEGDLPLESVYGYRLGVANPSQTQVNEIAGLYRDTLVPGAKQVIEALQALGSEVFIVSGGLFEPVRDFGVWLGVPRENIFAVGMEYDQLAGSWWRYWEYSDRDRRSYMAYEANPLAGTGGKPRVISAIRTEHPGRAMLVGDGGSDLEAQGAVDLFVGFGGVEYRETVAKESQVYIHSLDLCPILPLALGQTGNRSPYSRVWAQGYQRILDGEVHFLHEEARSQFLASMRAGRSR